MSLPGLARFWNKVNFTDTCWLWTGAKIPSGYGSFGDKSYHTIKAHRYAYQQCVGPIPDGKVLMHSCDNPACVNPDHLAVGTQLENVRDRVLKNRNSTKLTIEQVAEIRRRAATGELQRTIAADFGIQQPAVSRIIHGVMWGHTK